MVGIGTVQNKIVAGVIRDLTDVWYVPRQRRTLSQLECEVKIAQGDYDE